MFIEILKSGMEAALRNWKLAVFKLMFTAVYLIGFALMVAAPIVFLFGASSNSAARHFLDNPFGFATDLAALFFQNLFGLGVVLFAFFLYLLIAGTMALFVFAGTVGVMGRSVLAPENFSFSFSGFMHEGARLFMRSMWLTLLLGLLLMGLVVALIIGGAVLSSILAPLFAAKSAVSHFLATFLSLIGGSVAIGACILLWTVSNYSIAILGVAEMGASAIFSEAAAFLRRSPDAILVALGTGLSAFLAAVVVILLAAAFELVPVIGHLLMLPAFLASQVVNDIIGFAMLGSLMRFYRQRTAAPN